MASDKFAKCLVDALKKKSNFGKKKLKEAREAYERYRDRYMADGDDLPTAAGKASEQVLRELEETRLAKIKAAKASVEILSDIRRRLDAAEDIRTVYGKGNAADKIYIGLKSLLEDDPRIRSTADAPISTSSLMTEYNVNRGKFWALFRDNMDYFSKGAFGVQRGKAHFDNVVRELFLEGSSNDQAAKNIAQAFKQFRKMYVNAMNETAVTLRQYPDEGLPAHFSAVKLSMSSADEFTRDMSEMLDWNKTLWPNGDAIAPAERAEFLQLMWQSERTGDRKVFEKRWGALGGRVAKEQDEGRVLQFKDADAWMQAHNKYGDGSVFDVVDRSIDKAAFNLGVAKMFGANPDYMLSQIRLMAIEKANTATKGTKPQQAAHKIAKHLRRFDTMADTVLRHNPMDPESALAATISTTGNLATSAMLKSAVFAAVAGDTMVSVATRLANNQPVVRFLGDYIRAMFPGNYRAYGNQMTAAGFVLDDFISNNFIAARFGAGQQFGPAFSRRVADFTMRQSLMSRHTMAMRAANQSEMMARLAQSRNMKLADIPERVVFERAGITADEWDRVRASMKTWQPTAGAELFRPLDMVDELGHDLVNKFQSMIWNESHRMVLSSSVEASARMRMGLRPETAAGAFLHSASMFHGFPVTALMTFSRLLMSLDTVAGRTKLLAALGIGGAIAGAFTMQLRNLVSGKELDSMDSPEFWLKALAAGGSLGLWGDYITGAMRSDTRTATVLMLGGPIASMIGEVNDLTLGTAFQWAQIGDRTSEWTWGAKGSDLIDFARRNVIPQTYFYSLVLERDILDQLKMVMDPQGTKRSNRRRIRTAKEQGTPYRRGLEPGRGILTR